jgi:uncharacterized repeat protein (TIGR03803 family)
MLDFNVANGQNPESTLLISRNKLFGMTLFGGASTYGNVFSIDTSGFAYKDMLDFNMLNGQYPNGNLTLSGNKLFGLAHGGGANGYGVLFSIDSNGTSYIDLFNFNNPTGANPYGSLTLSGNKFYGMTSGGGTSNFGVIFSFKDTSIVTAVNHLAENTCAVTLYPNPNKGKFEISLNHVVPLANGITSSLHLIIEIYDMLGQKVYSQSTIDNSQMTINLRERTSGVYLYRIISETGDLISEGKFIVAK